MTEYEVLDREEWTPAGEEEFISLREHREKRNRREGAELNRLFSAELAKQNRLKNGMIDDMLMSYPYWEAGQTYTTGEIVSDGADGRQYIVLQQVTALEHQPPHAEGMLAVYRPVPRRLANGVFLFIYGQNVFAGDMCQDENGVVWQAQTDMLPCVWPPAEGNEWRKCPLE